MTDRAQPSATAAASYQRWRAVLRADPHYQAIAAEEAAKSDLGLQLAEARQAAGLSREELAHRLNLSADEVVRMEEGDADEYPFSTLRRFVAALGQNYALVVAVHRGDAGDESSVATG